MADQVRSGKQQKDQSPDLYMHWKENNWVVKKEAHRKAYQNANNKAMKKSLHLVACTGTKDIFLRKPSSSGPKRK